MGDVQFWPCERYVEPPGWTEPPPCALCGWLEEDHEEHAP